MWCDDGRNEEGRHTARGELSGTKVGKKRGCEGQSNASLLASCHPCSLVPNSLFSFPSPCAT